jgi:hypothetical protein
MTKSISHVKAPKELLLTNNTPSDSEKRLKPPYGPDRVTVLIPSTLAVAAAMLQRRNKKVVKVYGKCHENSQAPSTLKALESDIVGNPHEDDGLPAAMSRHLPRIGN